MQHSRGLGERIEKIGIIKNDMNFLTTVPLILGKPANIWVGIILGILIILQVFFGVMLSKGKSKYLKAHKINAGLILLAAAAHAYWGLGLWFLNFTVK